MPLEVDGQTIELTETGFLADPEQWNKDVATQLAANESIELTERHWQVVDYLRGEYFNNNANQPNNRTMLKAMSERWNEKVSSKQLYELFPGNPSKQAGLIGGLPESLRKGGY
jgi:tRNA 2-thiouridine synthesizing protein E